MNKPEINIKSGPPDRSVFLEGLTKYNELKKRFDEKRPFFFSAKALLFAMVAGYYFFVPENAYVVAALVLGVLLSFATIIFEANQGKEIKAWEWAAEFDGEHPKWSVKKDGCKYPEIAKYLNEVKQQGRRLSFCEFEEIFGYWTAQGNDLS